MENEEKKNEQQPLPAAEHKKKSFLVYLTILFVVAFLLVLLSYLMQLRDSRATISELNESSMSALANAQRLQQANETLSEENTDLREQMNELKNENEDLQSALSDAEAAANRDSQTALAYETLLRAKAAKDSGDTAALSAAIAELEELQGYLSAQGEELLRQLRLDLSAETAE